MKLRLSPWRWLYQRVLHRHVSALDEGVLRRSAIVFAPHQDDETLGCGGTVIKKRQAGADVKIVFMTDGSGSHSSIIPESELKVIRAEEAISASQKLGLLANDVILLGFKDGELGESFETAVHEVSEILRHDSPDEVFIPYNREPPADHVNTNKVVLAALKTVGLHVTVYEYPVWFWYHWPWVSIWQDTRRNTLAVLKNTLAATFGGRLFTDFRHSVRIEDVLEQKQIALGQHKSQMTQLVSDSRWLTLSDISRGEFLACFFQEYEIFRRYRFPRRD